MIVSGAKKCLFMVSDGTEQNMAYCWYEADAHPDHRAAVLAGWAQFERDIAAFDPASVVADKPAAAPVEGLPSVFVQVAGSLSVTDNLAKFGDALRSFIDRTPKKPETDDEFAVCESAIKTLSKAEEALDAAESAALAQVACIDDMRTLKATLKDLARSNRLALEKLVKAEKENRRSAIVQKAQKDLSAFVAAFPSAEYFPVIVGDFGSAIRGLKTMASIQNAVDTELARVKIEATAQAQKIAANLAAINEHPEHRAMFADMRTLVLKDCEFVALTVKQRIADHVAEIAKREEDARVRIQAEADAKAKAEADRVIEAERAKIRAEEEARAKEAAAQAIQEAAPVIAMPAPNIAGQAPNISQASTTARRAPSMSIGTISKLLGFTVSREFLSSLGFEGTKDRAAYLYHEDDFGMICNAIARHVMAVAAQEGQAAA
jgi:Sec-independent protein translocase protein TatA